MRKAIILKGQDEGLDALLAQGDDLQTRAEQELGFLRKQFANAKERLNLEAKKISEEVEAYIAKAGLLPKDYQAKNPEHHIIYDAESGVLYACMGHKEERNPIEMMINSLINRD